jgi:hypothetical protein
VLANKRISSILKQSSSPYQGLYKKLKSWRIFLWSLFKTVWRWTVEL